MWQTLLSLAINFINYWLAQQSPTNELRQAWLSFIDRLDQSSLVSAKVLSSYQDQLQKFRDEQKSKTP